MPWTPECVQLIKVSAVFRRKCRSRQLSLPELRPKAYQAGHQSRSKSKANTVGKIVSLLVICAHILLSHVFIFVVVWLQSVDVMQKLSNNSNQIIQP